MLVFGRESKKEGVLDLELTRGCVSKFYWLVAFRKSSRGACKSFCMNFDSFKIVDSGLP